MMSSYEMVEVSDKIFGFATPAPKEFNRFFREKAFEIAIKYDVDLIFTYVCACEMEAEKERLKTLEHQFVSIGGDFYFVELSADIRVRLARNETPHTMEKTSKKDITWSKANLLSDAENHKLNLEENEFWFESHIKIDNSILNPDEVADIVIRKIIIYESREKLSTNHQQAEKVSYVFKNQSDKRI